MCYPHEGTCKLRSTQNEDNNMNKRTANNTVSSKNAIMLSLNKSIG